MTYTCKHPFTSKREYKTGDKLNATEYIALPAQYRVNFELDDKSFKPRIR